MGRGHAPSVAVPPADLLAPEDRRGFTLAVVIFLLFAIGVAAATGFQVIQSEQLMAVHASDGARARALAETGLGIFVGEHIGMTPADTVYELEAGDVEVTPWRLYDVAGADPIYVVTARAETMDPRFADAPAVRVVREYHRLRRRPIEPLAALSHSGWVILQGANVTGIDQAPAGGCWGAPQNTGGIAVGSGFFNLGGSVSGSPATRSMGSQANLINAIETLPWDALTHPQFPVDHHDPGAWPAPPPGVFPVIRVTGTFQATQARSGRGVLIVDGFLVLNNNFVWDGVILAGGMSSPAAGTNFTINGMLVSGLSGAPMLTTLRSGQIRYHSCHVRAAMQGLAYLQPVANTWWESL